MALRSAEIGPRERKHNKRHPDTRVLSGSRRDAFEYLNVWRITDEPRVLIFGAYTEL